MYKLTMVVKIIPICFPVCIYSYFLFLIDQQKQVHRFEMKEYVNKIE